MQCAVSLQNRTWLGDSSAVDLISLSKLNLIIWKILKISWRVTTNIKNIKLLLFPNLMVFFSWMFFLFMRDSKIISQTDREREKKSDHYFLKRHKLRRVCCEGAIVWLYIFFEYKWFNVFALLRLNNWCWYCLNLYGQLNCLKTVM